MHASRARLAASIALVAAAAAWLGADAAVSAWLRMTGALVSVGSGTAAFGGKPVAMFSVYGMPAGTSGSETAGLYHVLVIFPADSVAWAGSDHGGDDLITTTHDEWTVWSRGYDGGTWATDRSLESRYNPLLNRVTIHGRTFSLERGNLFVARFRRLGQVEVVQLPRRVSERGPKSVIKAYQAALPGDAVVRDVNRYRQAPCPRPAPSAVRTSEA